MASQYFAILTDYGTRAIAHALSQGQPLQLAKFAVGDGNGQAVTPTASATALAHQTHIAPVSAVSLDPRNNKQVIVELTIPENIGGFYIREMGVFDSQNKLIAYANCPESFKPTESSGSGKVQVLRMILKVESSSAVTLSIDHSVIFVTRQQMAPKTITATTQNGFDENGHSHEIAKASTTQQGIVQLTNDTGLESESLALTAKAGKKLAQLIATVQLALNNYIPLNKRSSAVNSNDENNVATSKAVKTAYDKGVEAKNAADNAQRTANDGVSKANNAQRSADDANTNANGRVSKNGDEIDGDLRINGQNGNWSKLQFGTQKGVWALEVHPESYNVVNRRFNMKYTGDSNVFLAFPSIGDNGETVAYRSWVEDRRTPWSKISDKPAYATRWPNAVEQGYSHSLGRTGWTKLPSGLIIQWGEVNGMGVHKFPIAFNSVGQVFVCERSYSDDGEIIVVRDVNNTSFRAWARRDMGAFLFFAIGS